MEKTEKSVGRRIAGVVVDVLLGLIILLGILVSVYSLSSRSTGGVPSFFGKSSLVVESDSMTGTVNKGDLIFIEKFSASNPIERLETDRSVVTFYFDIDGDGSNELVTHLFKGTEQVGTQTLYTFQGTYNPADVLLDTQYVSADKLIGTYTGTRIAGLGTVLDFLRSPLGFGLIIILPIFLFFIYALVRLILALMETKKPKTAAVSAEEREKIKAELLAEIEKEQAKDAIEEQDK